MQAWGNAPGGVEIKLRHDQTMSFKTTFALLLILVGLGAYVYVVEIPREEQEERAKKLFDLSADEVDRLTLTRGDETIALERADDDNWNIVEPLKTQADKGAVQSLLNAIVDCKVDKELAETDTELERFGLAEPLVTVSVSSQGSEADAVRVGNAAPVGNLAYIQRVAGGAVLLTNAGFRSQVDKKLDDLRDRRLFDFEDEQVQWFELQRGAREIRLERGADGAWGMVKPDAHAGDAGAIRTYLSSLRALRAASFIADEPTELATYELDEARLRVKFALGDDQVHEIQLGGEKTETEIYAKKANAAAVYTVNDWAFRNLDKSARDLRDKTLFAFAADAVRAVNVVRKNGDDFRLLRQGDQWEIAGVDGVVKQADVEQYVKDLAELAGYEIVSDKAEDLPAFGFDTPLLQVSVFGESDAPLGSVVIAKTERDDGIHNFNAKSADSETVVLVRSYIFNRLDIAPTTLIEATAETPAADGTE